MESEILKEKETAESEQEPSENTDSKELTEELDNLDLKEPSEEDLKNLEGEDK